MPTLLLFKHLIQNALNESSIENSIMNKITMKNTIESRAAFQNKLSEIADDEPQKISVWNVDSL